jgi:hypothetical protein
MPGLSKTSVLSLTGVLLSTAVFQVTNRPNDSMVQTILAQALPLTVYATAWILCLACHYFNLISDAAARILICQMVGVHVNIWKQRWTGTELSATEYLNSSIWCAHVGMVVAVVWIWRVNAGSAMKGA